MSRRPAPSAQSRRRRRAWLVLETGAPDGIGGQLLRRRVNLQMLDVLERNDDERALGLDHQVARLERFLQPRGSSNVAVRHLLRKLEQLLGAVGEMDGDATICFHILSMAYIGSISPERSATRWPT